MGLLGSGGLVHCVVGSHVVHGAHDMKTIWRYCVPIHKEPVEIDIPEVAKLLHVGQQDDKKEVNFWVEVDPAAVKKTRTFIVYPTGYRMNPDLDLKHMGTVIDDGLVWHLYEIML